MKNVWRGLVVGALTGAGVGLVLDGLERSGRVGRELAEQGRDKLAEAHLGTRAHDAATDIADSVRSDLAPAAKDALASATKTVKEEVGPKVDAARDAVGPKIDAATRAVRDKAGG
jgi:hypothetical protein